MKHKSSYYTILLLAAIIGCVLRFWNLTAGIDAQGLPYSGHISAYLMAGWWVLCALLFAVISKLRSGLSSDHSVPSSPAGLGRKCSAISPKQQQSAAFSVP